MRSAYSHPRVCDRGVDGPAVRDAHDTTGVIDSVAKSVLTLVRERLATEAGAPDPRQRQYAVLVLVAVVAGTAVGWVFDLHTPALIAGLTAVLALVAAVGPLLPEAEFRYDTTEEAVRAAIATANP